MSVRPQIAIIGAGPGGLTLANLLHKSEVPYTVYELDASPHERNQGGTLDLHPRDGQLALREAGLWDQFAERARPESDVKKMVRCNGEVLWDENGRDAKIVSEEDKFNSRPEIDRSALKEILLSSLPPATLKWGMKLVKVVPAEEENFDLHFADGTVEKGFDLVVGADGAWSKVRQLLTDSKPYYAGISLVEMWALNVEENHKWISEYVGLGSLFSFDEGRAIQSQRIGDGSVRTYASVRQPESFIKDCGIDWTKPDLARKEYVKRYFDDCGEELKRLLLESTDELIPRQLYMLPVGFRWESRPGITLVGDAAHLMTPFAGVGVNVAMADGLELGRTIIGYVKDPNAKTFASALKDYEEEMFRRGRKNAQKTADNMIKHFSADGTEEMVGRLKSAISGRSS